MAILQQLGHISTDQFMAEYWQQKPLLVRGAFAEQSLDLSGDELAGLALEPFVESRIVKQLPGDWRQGEHWQLMHGPFNEDTFDSLSSSHWTLLVQAVDHFLPSAKALLGQFGFIPNWRLDDVMVSYAADQGSVGPHFDQYDVFLIQGMGKRRWQIGQICGPDTPLMEETPLSLVPGFTEQAAWELSPGDMLYLPPKVAHWGTAIGESVTYSVGFRAPKKSEALGSFCDFLTQQPSLNRHFRDQLSSARTNSAEISREDIEQLRTWLLEEVQDKTLFNEWLGCELTRNKYHEAFDDCLDAIPEEILTEGFLESEWQHSLDSRWSYSEENHRAKLFVDGRLWPTSRAFAQSLCAVTQTNGHSLVTACKNDQDRRALAALVALELLIEVE